MQEFIEVLSKRQEYLNNDLDRQVLQEIIQMYELVLENIYNGVLITDPKGYVLYMNKPYGDFLGLDPKAQIGRHCTQVVENTRMHLVAKTGKPEFNSSHRIMGQNMVVQRIPIFKNGKVVAVFGQVMFKDVKDVGKLAQELRILESKLQIYEQELMSLRSSKLSFEDIVGDSPTIRELKAQAFQAAGNDLPVLITGESGTGKDVFAQAIHHAGTRRTGPFVRINCAAIPRDLMESELFGYAKGAFTGALAQGKPGKFELADKGTVFLDEIGELPLEMQPKLLRVLEDKELERVGGTSLIKPDFRLIAATNKDLQTMLEDGEFRQDLFYRLNVVPLHIPPLRERAEDVLPLAEHILSNLTAKSKTNSFYLEKKARKVLSRYSWPGNVRELVNVLERTVSVLTGSNIDAIDLPIYLQANQKSGVYHDGTLRRILRKAEKNAIKDALQAAGGNKAEAARILGIHRTLLYKKLSKYRLEEKK